MPKSPKERSDCDPREPREPEKEDLWESDQIKRGYYYDDSHGYEEYDPDKDEDE